MPGKKRLLNGTKKQRSVLRVLRTALKYKWKNAQRSTLNAVRSTFILEGTWQQKKLQI